MNDSVKVARENRKAEQSRIMLEALKTTLSNPVIELVGGLWLLDELRKANPAGASIFQKLESTYAGMIGTTGLVGLIGLQQIAPAIPAMVQSAPEMLKTITSAAPLLLK